MAVDLRNLITHSEDLLKAAATAWDESFIVSRKKNRREIDERKDGNG